MDELIFFGDAVKALDDSGRVGGYLVRFTDSAQKDLAGDYFTPETYFGAGDGDGRDTLFHHGIPVAKGLEELADHVFSPMKTKKDEVGIWAETVLNQSDKYEAKVLELVGKGKIGWSSGSSNHLAKREKDGRIKRWIISEGSLTHMPCDPLNRAVPIKSLSDIDFDGVDKPAPVKAVDGERLFTESLRQTEQQTWELWSAVQTGVRKIVEAALAKDVTGVDVDVRQAVTALVGAYSPKLIEAIVSQVTDYLNSEVREEHFYLKSVFDSLTPDDSGARAALKFADHLEVVLAAAREVNQRAQQIQEMRVKAGRVISSANRTRLSSLYEMCNAVAAEIEALLKESEPKDSTKSALPSLAALRMKTLRLESEIAGVPLRG